MSRLPGLRVQPSVPQRRVGRCTLIHAERPVRVRDPASVPDTTRVLGHLHAVPVGPLEPTAFLLSLATTRTANPTRARSTLCSATIFSVPAARGCRSNGSLRSPGRRTSATRFPLAPRCASALLAPSPEGCDSAFVIDPWPRAPGNLATRTRLPHVGDEMWRGRSALSRAATVECSPSLSRPEVPRGTTAPCSARRRWPSDALISSL